MNIIDISSWQAGIDLSALFSSKNSLDGVIVKLTEGKNYVNPYANEWLNWLKQNKKLFGTYHYLDGSGAKAEAQNYVQHIKSYPGGILALDYEDAALIKGTNYLKDCLDAVYQATGIKPLVYCSVSVVQSQDFRAIAEAGYRLWVAQYADMKEVHGFTEKPWQNGSVAPFSGYAMHQYSCCGHLIGWDGNLDFDLFYGTADDWLTVNFADPIQSVKEPDPEVISAVLHGKYGIGVERIQKLTAAGYDAAAVQTKINTLYAVANKIRPAIANDWDYLNSIVYILKQ